MGAHCGAGRQGRRHRRERRSVPARRLWRGVAAGGTVRFAPVRQPVRYPGVALPLISYLPCRRVPFSLDVLLVATPCAILRARFRHDSVLETSTTWVPR